jgi:exopolyphosphatase/guanosine-5'-triphosphate,3'-diphosphate pyrophosphatase
MGGVEISVYNQGSLQFAKYIKVGSLRLREVLAHLERLTLDFPSIMEEFVKSKVYLLESQLREMKINNFLGLGEELTVISDICRRKQLTKEDTYIEKTALRKLYSELRKLTTEQND